MHAGGRCVCKPLWFVIGWGHTCAFFRFCFYDLLLHAVFAKDIGKHLHPCWCFFFIDCPLTQILHSVSFIHFYFNFYFLFLLRWVYCWLYLTGLTTNEYQEGLVLSMCFEMVVFFKFLSTTATFRIALSFWWGWAPLLSRPVRDTTATQELCLLAWHSFTYLFYFFTGVGIFGSTQTSAVLLWPWQSPSVGC